MQHHPCRECAMLEQDKNNATCRDCNKRLQYVNELELQLNFSRCCDSPRFALGGPMSLSRTLFGAARSRLFVNLL
jgi:hypothetical protein